MLYAFNDAKAAERHETQYFEMFCNRGIYHKGWTAVTRHGVPWSGAYKRAFDDDVWELYDTNTDWTQAHDLAKEQPQKLAELQRLLLIEATKYNVLPLDDRTFERFNADMAGRPQLIKGNYADSVRWHGSADGKLDGHHEEQVVLASRPRSRSRGAGAKGVIIAQGGAIGGWSLYAQDGKLKLCYNFFGIQLFIAEGTQPDPCGQAPGADGVQVRRRRSGQGRRRVPLRATATRTAKGRVEATVPMIFSADETMRYRQRVRHHRALRLRPDRTTSSAARSTGSRSIWRRMTTTT